MLEIIANIEMWIFVKKHLEIFGVICIISIPFVVYVFKLIFNKLSERSLYKNLQKRLIEDSEITDTEMRYLAVAQKALENGNKIQS